MKIMRNGFTKLYIYPLHKAWTYKCSWVGSMEILPGNKKNGETTMCSAEHTTAHYDISDTYA